MGNAKTRTIKLSTIMRSRAFQKGMKDQLAGEWDETITRPDWQWHYERGRQFAALTGGRIQVKSGRDVLPQAIRAFADGIGSKTIL